MQNRVRAVDKCLFLRVKVGDDPDIHFADHPGDTALVAEIDEFKGAWRALDTLAPERLSALRRVATIARAALDQTWPFLEGEPDVTDADREHANALGDLIARETFFRELPAIDQHTKALEDAYAARLTAAVEARSRAYEVALEQLYATPGWEQIDDDQRHRIAELLANYTAAPAKSPSIPQLRADADASAVRRNKAVEELLRLLDGNRVVKVSAASYFSGGVETEEQLDQALDGLKEQCLELIGAGKKVLIQ